MATVQQTQPTVQLLLANSDYVGALDLIATTQDVVHQELAGVQSFRCVCVCVCVYVFVCLFVLFVCMCLFVSLFVCVRAHAYACGICTYVFPVFPREAFAKLSSSVW